MDSNYIYYGGSNYLTMTTQLIKQVQRLRRLVNEDFFFMTLTSTLKRNSLIEIKLY